MGGDRVVQNFSELFLRDDVVASLTRVGATKPTVIQMLATPKILRGKNVLFASETGTSFNSSDPASLCEWVGRWVGGDLENGPYSPTIRTCPAGLPPSSHIRIRQDSGVPCTFD